ncbi:MAG TPA: hypothetical protein VGX48_10305 [Pyrinomonadaceae bacterium]|jgi:hypothetical protein|nr:hypothetical protein [Pyrinomonadaceae bacterium]
MRTTRSRLRLGLSILLVVVCARSSVVQAQNPCAPSAPGNAAPLAAETFELDGDREVGLEIEARSPGASWARKGSEAAALVVLVDGAYNQDVMLWAGDEFYGYRVMLGRLAEGKHKVSVSLNAARSAAGARRAEVKALRPIISTAADAEERFALAHTPALYARPNTFDHFTDIPLLMYYELLREAGDLVVRYTVVFTNEDGGTQTAALFARWGRGTDIEWVYEIRARGGKVVAETFQGVRHETKAFAGQRAGGEHPLLTVASDNNNFSDLACSAVRFAPLPSRARLEAATRESVMDAAPVTYRAMTEELQREGRISDTPSDINTVADPREYLYVEAASEQEGAAVAFDVKLTGRPDVFASDMGEPRLRIERSGYFRTAIRLPKGVSPGAVESVTARCHPHPATASGGTCKRLKLVRVLTLGRDFLPRELPLKPQPESALAAGETKVFRLAP